MITPNGYSKDPNIIPEGIVVTWGKDLIEEKGGLISFIRYFEQSLSHPEGIWMHKCKNRPTMDNRLLYVYIIVCNRLQYRCYYGGYEKGETIGYNGDGHSWSSSSIITWPRILLAGPFEKAPFKRKISGFRGFRYCTKLF